MRLIKARVQNYRSIVDTGLFEIETAKTIFVGPNEAGKTALLQALQQINPPPDVPKFDVLRDYPRAKFNDITTKKVLPKDVRVVEAHFSLEQADLDDLPAGFDDCTYVFWRSLDNSAIHELRGGPESETCGNLKKDLIRLCAHLDARVPTSSPSEGTDDAEKPSVQLKKNYQFLVGCL